MHRILILLFLSIALSGFGVQAKNDPEIMESKKCSAAFSYFEKKNNIPKDTLYSISLQETQKAHSKHGIAMPWPWTVTVNPSGRGYHFKNQREAIKFAKAYLEKGKGSIDVGCMQINLKYHPDAFSSIEQSFSPRRNIAYGAKFLKEKYAQHKDWDQAIGAYHSNSQDRASSYISKVTKISSSIDTYKNKFASLSKISYNSPKRTKATNSQQKLLSMNKIQVHVGTLKENNWFRRAK